MFMVAILSYLLQPALATWNKRAKFFLETMGIIERAKIIEKNMNNDQKKDLFLRLRRLLHKDSMGKLFKVIFAYNCKKNNFLGFS